MDDTVVFDDLQQKQELQDSKTKQEFTQPRKAILLHAPYHPVLYISPISLLLLPPLSRIALTDFRVS